MTAVDARAAAIFEAVQRRLHVSPGEMAGPSGQRRETHARYLAMSLLREAGWTNQRIGDLFNRHRTIVPWACRCVYGEVEYAADLAAIREALPREATS